MSKLLTVSKNLLKISFLILKMLPKLPQIPPNLPTLYSGLTWEITQSKILTFGTTITYSKDDLFLTFGVKNIYSGSGDNKKIIGYKAFIEHN